MNRREEQGSSQLDVEKLLLSLWEHRQIILFAGIFLGMAAFFITKLAIKPLYESTTKIYVCRQDDNGKANVNYNDLLTGDMITQDYQQMILSRDVLETVRDDLQLAYSVEKLKDKITVSNPSDTRIIDIAVRDANPFLAREIADEVRELAIVHMEKVVDEKLVNTVERADIADFPVEPNTGKNMLIGFLVGFCLSGGWFLFCTINNDTVNTKEDVARYLHLPVLAQLPQLQEEHAADHTAQLMHRSGSHARYQGFTKAYTKVYTAIRRIQKYYGNHQFGRHEPDGFQDKRGI